MGFVIAIGFVVLMALVASVDAWFPACIRWLRWELKLGWVLARIQPMDFVDGGQCCVAEHLWVDKWSTNHKVIRFWMPLDKVNRGPLTRESMGLAPVATPETANDPPPLAPIA